MHWEGLHHLPSGDPMPCTALAVCGGGGGMGVNVVTGGEDGRITVLRTSDLQPLTVIGMCDNHLKVIAVYQRPSTSHLLI